MKAIWVGIAAILAVVLYAGTVCHMAKRNAELAEKLAESERSNTELKASLDATNTVLTEWREYIDREVTAYEAKADKLAAAAKRSPEWSSARLPDDVISLFKGAGQDGDGVSSPSGRPSDAKGTAKAGR